jgi:L-fuconolactonase
MAVVDSHFHVWDPAMRDHAWLAAAPRLNQRFSIEQFEALAHASGADAAVLVQVLNDLDETYEFLALAADNPTVAGVVGWVDLEAPDVADVVAALREARGGEYLVGVRHVVQAEPDARYLERPAVLRGLRAIADASLVFDLLVDEAQLPAAVNAVREVENLAAVLDHGGKPRIAGRPKEPWSSLVAQLAATGRVHCKISGLVNEAGPEWTNAAIGPFVDRLLSVFGVERVLFGSDWPVCTLVATYPEVLDLVRSRIAGLSRAEQAAVMGANARKAYGLRAPPVRL